MGIFNGRLSKRLTHLYPFYKMDSESSEDEVAQEIAELTPKAIP